MAESTSPHSPPAHAALATVFQVRDDELQVLLWERAREPFRGDWSLPGGSLGPGRDARGVDPAAPGDQGRRTRGRPPRAAGHLERPFASSGALGARDRLRRPRPTGHRPARPRGHPLAPRGRAATTAFDHGAIVLAGRERLRGKLSYSNVGFALAPEMFTLAELRDIYAAALGYDVSSTNLKRVLLRRGAIETTGGHAHTRSWRRPAGGGLPLPEEPPRGHRSVRSSPSANVSAFVSADSGDIRACSFDA